MKNFVEYKPNVIFKNKHFNTIYPSLFRKVNNVKYERNRLITEDNDFVDIDMARVNSKKLVILLHGLEGHSDRNYIKGMCKIFNENNWDACAMNYRGCSEEMNKTLRFYHGGATDDVNFLISSVEKDYEEIVLVGFSLGANMALKYVGDGVYKLNSKLKGVAAISVPCDLKGAMKILNKKENIIYTKRFLKGLKEKVLLKRNLFSDESIEENLKNVRSLKEFDDQITAPIHGFKNAYDYYEKCSCKQFLRNIKIPTLIINALDDPFLNKESFPIDEAKENENLLLLMPKYGGHVGFTSLNEEYYWTEKTVVEFMKNLD